MSTVETLSDFRLLPVVDLEPAAFKASTRTAPGDSTADAPDACGTYWRDALADAGIHGVEPIAVGSWYAPTNALRDANLQRLLRAVAIDEDDDDDPSDWNDPDEIPGLPGGFCLVDSKRGVVIHPECCGDLGVIAQWRSAAEYRGVDWDRLWIGHPERWIRHVAPFLEISGPCESIDGAGAIARWRVDSNRLAIEVERAEAELRGFSDTLIPILRAWGCREDVVGAIAETFAGVRSNWY
ncbi:MAG TPA: hypothetical protein P5081_24110 [Phycisphaerae bacterium]|nr:hypothetical protein [Phycisphaerae bacterium]HRW55971.1 hypothetical protein [Phycisphaerae bacterium]